MADIKPMNEIADKWASVTPQRSGEYRKGVQNPRRSWSQGAVEAAESWAQGITQAITDGRFVSGIQEAGDSRWQRKASTVGAARFGPGVQAAKGDYQAGFAPFAQVIAGVDLPPRGAKGDPRNYDRVRVIGEALHEAKIRQ